MNDEGKVLAIKERFMGDQPLWKLPGGGADVGKHTNSDSSIEVHSSIHRTSSRIMSG